MIVSIQQPEHLPWVGFFNKMAQCDKFVLLDDVQFKKNYFENRNKIKTVNGIVWLTVPVKLRGKFGQKTCDVEIADDPRWKKKYYKTLEQTYCKAPHWQDVYDNVWPVLEGDKKKLLDINLGLIDNISRYLDIQTECVSSSSLNTEGAKKEELVLAICRELKAEVYISGPDGRNYLNLEQFKNAGIQVVFHDFNHPAYSQIHGPFVSHMSIVDLIANCGQGCGELVKECYRVKMQ